MKTNIYAIYDNVAKAYSQPYFCAKSPDHILGIRAFSNMVSPGTMLFDNPNDYTLYYIGELEDEDFTVLYDTPYTKLCTSQDIIDARINASNTHDIINNLKGVVNNVQD